MIKLPGKKMSNKMKRHIDHDFGNGHKSTELDNIAGDAKDVKDARLEGDEKGSEHTAIASMRRHNAQLVSNIHENIGNVNTASAHVDDTYARETKNIITLAENVIEKNNRLAERKRQFKADHVTGKIPSNEVAEIGVESPGK